MKIQVIALALLVSASHQYIDLSPAYKIQIRGSKDWKLVNTYSKPASFIEGFEMIDDENFFESVGQYWGSKIQKGSLNHDKLISTVLSEYSLPKNYFGEGCTKFKDYLYQMTYREGKVFLLDPIDFSV